MKKKKITSIYKIHWSVVLSMLITLHLFLPDELCYADVISTNGLDDGHLLGWSQLENTNYEKLAVQNGVSHSGDKGDISVVEFDISSINNYVNYATLNLYFSHVGSGAQADLYLNHYTNDGDGTVTFFNDYSALTENVEVISNVMTNIYSRLDNSILTFDITDYLNNDIQHGFNYSSYNLVLSKNPTSNSTLFFISADHASLPAPCIEYTLVPEPATILLLSLGGLAFRKSKF